MKCHGCGSGNREIVTYCEACGLRIAVTCPKCAFQVPRGKKFCGRCGVKLDEAGAVAEDDPGEKLGSPIDFSRPDSYTPKFMAEKILTTRGSIEGERKLVTVFFCDVSGFTSLSEALDPETVHEIMDGCFKILMQEIHAFEGTINQFTGDGVMALFGAPIAHEDHAQRACRAALSIQSALEGYGAKLDKRYGTNFKMRIGLNSGPVVVGAIGDDLRMDYTAVGDTTNLAARMESMAEPGGILISHSTFRQVDRYFETESLGPVAVKGKKNPQHVYTLVGESSIRSRLDASRARGLVEYIGREEELSELQKACDTAVDGQGRVVGVVGEPGIGKSRFVYEIQHRSEDDLGFITARCLQYSATIPFQPIQNLVRSCFDMAQTDAHKELMAKLDKGLAEMGRDLASQGPAFRQLFSLPTDDPDWENLSPKEKRMGIFEALRNLFLGMANKAPLVLVVDDLQWLDKTSEEFLNYFIDWIPNARILLILLFRQEYSHSWGGKPFYRQIGLPPLTPDQSRLFITSLLDGSDISKGVETLIISRTSGNPLFMEELILSLRENRIISLREGQYQVERDETLLDQVPDSIQGIIAARMDRLDENVKLTMQVASVIGRNFAARLVQSLTGENRDIRPYLIRLQNLEFIHEKQVFPELEYIFKNLITQEVAYNSLLLNRRREIHGSCARAILEMYPDRQEAFYEIIAFHFSKSHDLEQAVTYLTLSGDKAVRNNSAHEALAFYKKALETLESLDRDDETNQEKLKLLHALISPTILLDFPEGSLELLEQGAQTAKTLGDCKSTIRFHSNMGFYHSVRGRPNEGLKYAGKAFSRALEINDLTSMAQASPDLVTANLAAGRYAAVIETTTRMLGPIKAAGRQRDTFGGPAMVYYTFYAIQGYCRAYLGDFAQGLMDCQRGLDGGGSQTNLFTMSLCRFYTGLAHMLKGDWAQALTHMETCLKEVEQVDFILIQARARTNLGLIRAFLGDPEAGGLQVEQGLSSFLENGLERNLPILQLNKGICQFLSKNLEEAMTTVNQAVETADIQNDPPNKAVALIWAGRIQGKLPDPAQALPMIQEGIELFEQSGGRPNMALGHYFLGEFLAHTAEKAQAAAQLEKALAELKRLEMTYWAEQCQALMSTLG